MRRLGLLTIHILVWALAFPAVSTAVAYLGRAGFGPADVGTRFHLFAAVLLVWACLIYWYAVPRAESVPRRAAYLVIFVAVMAAVGFCALWAAFVAVALVFWI